MGTRNFFLCISVHRGSPGPQTTPACRGETRLRGGVYDKHQLSCGHMFLGTQNMIPGCAWDAWVSRDMNNLLTKFGAGRPKRRAGT